MSEYVSRPSLIPALPQVVTVPARVSHPAPRPELLRRWLGLGTALLIVIVASGTCYELGMRMLAACKWQ